MARCPECMLKPLRELAQMQAELDAAEPGSLSWDFRNHLLEKVERLPRREQAHWKAQYGDHLKHATEPLEQWQTRQIPAQQGVS